MSEESEALAIALDDHTRKLLKLRGGQSAAVDWMRAAFNLMEAAAREIRKQNEKDASPKIYMIPDSFGCKAYMLDPPSKLMLPRPEYVKPAIWFEGKTVEYGDRYQSRRPWTSKDSRKLVEAQRRAKLAKGK